jgi:hypothetical protein
MIEANTARGEFFEMDIFAVGTGLKDQISLNNEAALIDCLQDNITWWVFIIGDSRRHWHRTLLNSVGIYARQYILIFNSNSDTVLWYQNSAADTE